MGTTKKGRIRNLEQMNMALDLRKTGATLQQVADTMGLKSRQRAHQFISMALKELQETCTISAEEMRTMQAERLDALQLKLWGQRQNPRVADTLLRIEARRAALFGLDAPTKIAETDSLGNDIPTEARHALHQKLLGD